MTLLKRKGSIIHTIRFLKVCGTFKDAPKTLAVITDDDFGITLQIKKAKLALMLKNIQVCQSNSKKI